MIQLLLVEDEIELALNIKNFLNKEGFQVTHAKNIFEIPANLNNFSLIILDWMLPDGQGLDVLKHLRLNYNTIPVIFLTARSDLIDKVLGLESGANDYITKPFEPRELLARIRVHLRGIANDDSFTRKTSEEICCGDIRINPTSREVYYKSQLTSLTRKEFDMLYLFITHQNKVFSREELLNKIWGFENFPTTRTVDTHVLQLRQKFGEGVLETVRGVGYKFTKS